MLAEFFLSAQSKLRSQRCELLLRFYEACLLMYSFSSFPTQFLGYSCHSLGATGTCSLCWPVSNTSGDEAGISTIRYDYWPQSYRPKKYLLQLPILCVLFVSSHQRFSHYHVNVVSFIIWEDGNSFGEAALPSGLLSPPPTIASLCQKLGWCCERVNQAKS